jgi:5-methylcytosine-specific restriction endonuclease McrA
MRRASAKRKQRYFENKMHMLRQLGGRCEECGFSDVRALQFDHIGPKRCNLTVLMTRLALAPLFDELHQCRLLCANCHAISTAESGKLRLGKGWV